MKFTFRFLLANGGTEHHTFTAAEFGAAFNSAFAYSRLAFNQDELIDFYWTA
jgi:hypothetical protein